MKVCKHINWSVESDDLIGRGNCHDCKQQVPLNVLFDNLKKRMEEVINRYENKKDKEQ